MWRSGAVEPLCGWGAIVFGEKQNLFGEKDSILVVVRVTKTEWNRSV
jgi:hypothetical protein